MIEVPVWSMFCGLWWRIEAGYRVVFNLNARDINRLRYIVRPSKLLDAATLSKEIHSNEVIWP
jgi:hypothetical protein